MLAHEHGGGPGVGAALAESRLNLHAVEFGFVFPKQGLIPTALKIDLCPLACGD
jgi:hypothetical protein